MRIGDQLELVTTLKDKKDKAVRRAEVNALMEDMGPRRPTPSTRARYRTAASSIARARKHNN